VEITNVRKLYTQIINKYIYAFGGKMSISHSLYITEQGTIGRAGMDMG